MIFWVTILQALFICLFGYAHADSTDLECKTSTAETTHSEVPSLDSIEYLLTFSKADTLLEQLKELSNVDIKNTEKPEIIKKLEESNELDKVTQEVDSAIQSLLAIGSSKSFSNEIRSNAYIRVSKLNKIRMMLEMPKVFYFTVNPFALSKMKSNGKEIAKVHGTNSLRAIKSAVKLGSSEAKELESRFIQKVTEDQESTEFWAPILKKELGLDI